MPIPHVALSESEQRLLEELTVAPLNASHRAREVAAARGIDLDLQHGELVSLRVKGLIGEHSNVYASTMLGEAVLHRARHQAADERLADVAAFAEALEVTHEPITRALRELTQGTIDLDQALDAIAGCR